MKKGFIGAALLTLLLVGCGGAETPTTAPTTEAPTTEVPTTTQTANNIDGYDYLNGMSDAIKQNFGAQGFVEGKIGDFSKYEGTQAYRKVSTAEELLAAIADAKIDYTNAWVYDARNADEQAIIDRLVYLNAIGNNNMTSDEKTERNGLQAKVRELKIPGHLEQTLNDVGSVHVIEITDDINLGYYKLSETAKGYSVVSDFASKQNVINALTMTSMFTENGISQISISNTNDLMIYSKNGAKLTHGGFKITSCSNIVFRNIEFDEMWQWEDSYNKRPGFTLGDYDAFGWAYFKISFCESVWIDHCTFGKSYDGQIDYSNPVYDWNHEVYIRAPYGANGGNGLHISNCYFKAGDASKDGYIYKMMEECKKDYLYAKLNEEEPKYQYYAALRDGGATHDDILYGVAIPQKKGFLLADSGDYFEYNKELKVSMANNVFKNLEDRLPKLRGGIAYIYNNIVDSSEYYEYRVKLQSNGVASFVGGQGQFKLALVSQGILAGLGGSVRAEDCIYSGVYSVIKNNDTSSPKTWFTDSKTTNDGGYSFVNMKIQLQDSTFVGSSSDAAWTEYITANPYVLTTSNSSIKLSTENFDWHNATNTQPFTPALYGLENLETILYETCPVGVNPNIADMYLYTTFDSYQAK